MFRDVTFTDVSRAETLDDASAGFVMDEDAFRAFYERNARGVWAYLVRVTGDSQLADDLLQETFYRFLRGAANHEGAAAHKNETHHRNSLYRIATNLARDARRRSLVRAPFSLTCSDIEQVPSGDDRGAEDRAADVTRAMSRLNPRERAMLWLAYAESASHNEIAEVLGLRPSSLKTLLFRARRRLAALLGMNHETVECEFEPDVLAAALQSRWPDRVDAQLRAHVAGCAICADVAAIGAAIDDARDEMRAHAVVPDSGRVWWLAQLRSRREATETAGRPITAVQVIALACAVGLLGACFGATSRWFQSALGRIESGLAGFDARALLAEHGAIVLAMAGVLFLVPAAVYLAWEETKQLPAGSR